MKCSLVSFTLICLSSMLFGCVNSQPAPPPLPIVQPKQQVNVDPRALRKCPPLPKVAVASYSQAQSLNIIAVYATLYGACQRQMSNLSDLTSDAFNLQHQTDQPPLPTLTPDVNPSDYLNSLPLSK